MKVAERENVIDEPVTMRRLPMHRVRHAQSRKLCGNGWVGYAHNHARRSASSSEIRASFSVLTIIEMSAEVYRAREASSSR